VVGTLALDPQNPNSIISCLRAARENARSVRETISSEMWEQVNTMYLLITGQGERVAPESMAEFYRHVRMACHLFLGVTDATMSHNEAWHFIRLGRELERADKTTRIVDVKYFILLPSVAYVGTPYDDIQWSAVLKSVSGFEMYRKRFGRTSPDRIVEFLLLDNEFPRAVRYCIVNSGRGPTQKEIQQIAEAVKEIRAKVGINICCSLGLMSEDKIRTLKDAGVGRINHNLNTSREHHPEIVTTHSYDDRVSTVQNVKSAGVGTCSGGIIGMGESDDDIIDLALTLRAMDIESIPVNFLHSIPKTPFEAKKQLTPQKCLKTLCLFRFVNPNKEIRVAGGREVNLRSLQPLSLYPANSIFVNGYLTTPGQEASDAHRMIEDLGFELDQPAAI
jgi:biotin synthase